MPHSAPSSTTPTPPAWRPQGWLQWLLLNLAGAVAYWAAARAGLMLAVGPSEVSVLWLPNGLALALVMVWGARVLPGLVLGSLVPASLFGLPQDIGGLNEIGISLLGAPGQRRAMVGDGAAARRLAGQAGRRRLATGPALCAGHAGRLHAGPHGGHGHLAQRRADHPGRAAHGLAGLVGRRLRRHARRHAAAAALAAPRHAPPCDGQPELPDAGAGPGPDARRQRPAGPPGTCRQPGSRHGRVARLRGRAWPI